MTLTASALLDVLRHGGLLDRDQRKEAERLAASRPSAQALAAALVGKGLLTQYQADELAAGRGAGLAVGSYVLLEKLGKGGMGQVFRARDVLLHRPAALKLILPERLGDGQARERFLREIRAAALLSHPNVVTIYHAGQAGATFYLAMELLTGHNLAEYLARRGPLPLPEACDYARQAALGLQHAHEKGLVHRDVKPHNLQRTDAVQVKVLDLGLALVCGA